MVTQECPDVELQPVLAAARQDPVMGVNRLEALVARYPEDARLHFLLGSLLAGAQRYDDGIDAMTRAVSLNPQYILARFQLGFLQLTCGKPEAAQATWLPLLGLANDDPFKLFVLGLVHLIRDEFKATIQCLEAGMAINQAQPLVNNDMQLIVDEVREILEGRPEARGEGQVTSETQLLFERYAVHDTSAYKH